MTQIDQDVLFTILNGLGIPVPQFFKEDGTPVKMSGNIAPWFELKDSNIMQQIDMQRRFQKSVQGITNATVPLTSGTFDSPWIDTIGFSEVSLSMSTDLEVAGAVYRMDLLWSHDNTQVHGEEKAVLVENGSRYRVATTNPKARWMKIRIFNKDSVPHVMNAWAYLKV